MPRSIHDNNIYAYTVECDSEQIVLHTEYHNGNQWEYTDVIFTGVLAHHFYSVLKGNILFSIEEVEPAAIVTGSAQLFADNKNYGWPQVEYKKPADLIGILNQQGIKGFEINSSFGMSGWVLALSMKLVEQTTKHI